MGVDGAAIALLIASIVYKVSNTVASLIIMKKKMGTYLLIFAMYIYPISISLYAIMNYDSVKESFIYYFILCIIAGCILMINIAKIMTRQQLTISIK